jgi:agmatinase
VGTPVPGGLSWQETTSFVEALFSARDVVSADIVELCPIPGQVASEFAAAQLAYKIAGHALRARPV